MKRILVLLSALAMLFAFSACEAEDEKDAASPDKKPDSHEHSYTETVTDATCTEKGYTTYTCDCGNSYTDKEVAAKGHTWGEWTVVEEAAYQQDGLESRTCSVCGDIEEKVLPALTEPPKTMIDPFAGLTIDVEGVSPYCKLWENNSGCSMEAQQYVTYSFDKETYANGDTAIVTAQLNAPTEGDVAYELTATTYEYQVKDQPFYIESLEGVDLTGLMSELEDHMYTKSASCIGTNYVFGAGLVVNNTGTIITSIDSFVRKDAYFLLVKANHREDGDKPYNKISFLYEVVATGAAYYSTGTQTFYVAIDAPNVIQYPDGTLKWGYGDPDKLEFYDNIAVKTNMDECVNLYVTAYRQYYNVTKKED